MLQTARRDYVSPGFKTIRLDDYFPNLVVGAAERPADDPHLSYCDRRATNMEFLNRDEAHILYNTALGFMGAQALEIGGFMGWSACHLAAAGVALDVIDPLLANPVVQRSVRDSLAGVGVLERVALHAGQSPDAVYALGRQGKTWSLMFVDGDHAFPGPTRDVVACERHAAADAAILLHRVEAPAVAEALHFLKDRGWKIRLYRTAHVMAAAWRGAVRPVDYSPDPDAARPLPDHVRELMARSE